VFNGFLMCYGTAENSVILYTNLSSKNTPKPALAVIYLLITMESSIYHCFNITGWRKYAH